MRQTLPLAVDASTIKQSATRVEAVLRLSRDGGSIPPGSIRRARDSSLDQTRPVAHQQQAWLSAVVHAKQDQILIVDLGPSHRGLDLSIETLRKPFSPIPRAFIV